MATEDTSSITDAPLTEQQYLQNAIAALEQADAEAPEPDAKPEAKTEAAPEAEAKAKDDEKPDADEQAKSEAALAKPTEEAAPAPEPDPLADLEEAIRQRAATREKPNDEIATLRQQLADMQRRLDERKANDEHETIAKLAREGRWKELAEAAGHDPLHAYEAFTKAAADSDKDQITRKLEALEKRWEERERAAKEREDADRQAAEHRQQTEARQQAIRGFLDFTAPSAEPGAAYPHVRAAPDGKRARDALFFADRLAAAGREVTYQAVAELMEAEYSRLARAWAPKVEKTETSKTEEKRTEGRATKAAESGTEPTTISSDLAAQSSGPDDRPKRSEDYFKDMLQVLQDL